MSLLDRQRTALVVIDVQEGFRSYESFEGVADACAKLVGGARILGLPTIVSEQYPKGLGHTAPEVGLHVGKGAPDAGEAKGGSQGGEQADGGPRDVSNARERVIEKTVFSAARVDGFDLGGREQAVVCGIETHVCVSQTVHDLLAKGVEVHVPADAVGSRHEIDYERGLERLERAGAVVSTVEAVLFELLQRAGTPEFKAVQKLIL